MPSNALFRDFCASLEAKLPHRWLSGKATRVCKDSSSGDYRVHYTMADGRERKAVARANGRALRRYPPQQPADVPPEISELSRELSILPSRIPELFSNFF